jgi:AcrR family transcriptional regulator
VTERGQRTRAKLLQATVDLVREVGYAQTTTRAVAQAAGVSEGTIYRHFPDKPTLLLAAALEQHAPIVRWMSELPARAGRGDLAETLSDCLGRLAEMRQTLLPLELAFLTDPELASVRNSIEVPPDGPDRRSCSPST